MKTIIVIVSPQGASSLETHGFAGSECQDASRFLERALGKTAEETLTSDFYRVGQTESQTESTRQQP